MTEKWFRTAFTQEELERIANLLREREQGRMTNSHVYAQLHRLGFYVNELLTASRKRGPLLSSDLSDLVELGAIQLMSDDEPCSVCSHSYPEHEMYGQSPRDVGHEGYIDAEGAFCADCIHCQADDDRMDDFLEQRTGRRLERLHADSGQVMGVEDWVRGGFSPAWDQPR